jgi:hypothetical protein
MTRIRRAEVLGLCAAGLLLAAATVLAFHGRAGGGGNSGSSAAAGGHDVPSAASPSGSPAPTPTPAPTSPSTSAPSLAPTPTSTPTRAPTPTPAGTPSAGHLTITFSCIAGSGCSSARFAFFGWGPGSHEATVYAGGTSHQASWSEDAATVTYGWRGPSGGHVYAAWDDGGGRIFYCRPATVLSPTTC